MSFFKTKTIFSVLLAFGLAAGVFRAAGVANIQNTIIAGNLRDPNQPNPAFGLDMHGAVTSQGATRNGIFIRRLIHRGAWTFDPKKDKDHATCAAVFPGLHLDLGKSFSQRGAHA